MNEILVFITSTFLGITLTILLSDPIQNLIAKLIGGWGLVGSNRKLSGYWIAEITYPVETGHKKENYIFELKQIGKLIIGKSISTDSQAMNSVKFKSRISNERYLTGKWKSRLNDLREYHGSLQLGLLPHGNRLEGKWIGFRRNFKVYASEWEMEKITDKIGENTLKGIKNNEKYKTLNWKIK